MQKTWANRVRSDAKRLWNDQDAIRDIFAKAVNFGVHSLRMSDADSNQAAQTSISQAWESCKFGYSDITTEDEFWAAVSKLMFKNRNNFKGKFVSLDEPIPGTEENLDRHSSGINGIHPPDQINHVYLAEVLNGIDRLPSKYRNLMKLLADGEDILDIAKKTRLPVHTVFRRITDARNMLGRIDWL